MHMKRRHLEEIIFTIGTALTVFLILLSSNLQARASASGSQQMRLELGAGMTPEQDERCARYWAGDSQDSDSANQSADSPSKIANSLQTRSAFEEIIAPFEPIALENCAINDTVVAGKPEMTLIEALAANEAAASTDNELADHCDPARAAILIAQRNQAFEDLIFTISSSLSEPVREVCEAGALDGEIMEPTAPDWAPTESGLHLAQLSQ